MMEEKPNDIKLPMENATQTQAAIAEELEQNDPRLPFLAENKDWRLRLDIIVQELKLSQRKSRERSIVITKLQEAIMWAGMDIKDLHEGKTCYPESYDPMSSKIHATMDSLKM